MVLGLVSCWIPLSDMTRTRMDRRSGRANSRTCRETGNTNHLKEQNSFLCVKRRSELLTEETLNHRGSSFGPQQRKRP